MVGIENLHRPGLTPACGLRRAKVGFRFPTIPFLYYEYKIRNISIFLFLRILFFPKGRRREKKPPPAGSDSGLWPPQGQSRFFGPINPILHLSFIQIQRIEFFLSTKLFSTKDRRRGCSPFCQIHASRYFGGLS